MRLGWVATADHSVRLREIGYDYIEMHLAPFGLEDAASLSNAKQRTCDLALPCEVLSLMFPRDLRLVGDAPMLDRARRYLGFATELMVHLRAEIVVYGSGWVRNLPSGFDAGRREQQYIESLNLVADGLSGSGAVCAIEPLNRKESDIANSVDEAVHYASLVNRREIKVLADFFHMQEEREPIETVVRKCKVAFPRPRRRHRAPQPWKRDLPLHPFRRAAPPGRLRPSRDDRVRRQRRTPHARELPVPAENVSMTAPIAVAETRQEPGR